MTALSPDAARRVYLTLSATRWLPVGFVIGVFTLLALERGLSVGEVTSYAAAQGIVVLLLELPSSAFADVFGRRPVLLVAGVVNLVAVASYLWAHTFWQFALAAGLMGVYRALDSGPLDAWYVDTLHAHDPEADPGPAFARFGIVLGLTIAAGSLLSGLLVAWHPLRDRSALLLPVLVCLALSVVHLVLTLLILREPRADAHAEPGAIGRAFRSAPGVLRDGLGLLRRNRVLAGIVTVEVFWVLASSVFESLKPIRLAELVGSEARAGVWQGPSAAAAWLVAAAGSWAIGRVMARHGNARAAIASRILNGLAAAAMGLVGGPLAFVGVYLVTNLFNGMTGPAHSALLHREATAANRATVLSLGSTVMFGATSVIYPAVGWCAEAFGTGPAMVGAGLISILGGWFYLPALRSERGARVAERDVSAS